jgi:hypothetical protein
MVVPISIHSEKSPQGIENNDDSESYPGGPTKSPARSRQEKASPGCKDCRLARQLAVVHLKYP